MSDGQSIYLRAAAIADSEPVMKIFAAPEWAELGDDGKAWVIGLVSETERRQRLALAELLHRYYARKVATLMHQAQHWLEEGQHPLAVHHRVRAADNFYQITSEFDPDRLLKGWDDPFDRLAKELAEPVIAVDGKDFHDGRYPPSAEIHAYRNPCYAAAKFTALTVDEPASAPLAPDVVRLVIAARRIAFEFLETLAATSHSREACEELDRASEAFASRVPWDDQPDEAQA